MTAYKDNDVFEVQIIEKLQRQDVEPTEEAEAITYLSEKYAPTEIATRLGRTDNFIRQRLKLAGLIDGFKQFVRNDHLFRYSTIRIGRTADDVGNIYAPWLLKISPKNYPTPIELYTKWTRSTKIILKEVNL